MRPTKRWRISAVSAIFAIIGTWLAVSGSAIAAADFEDSIAVRQAVNPLFFNLNNPPASNSQPIGSGILERRPNEVSVSISGRGYANVGAPYTAWWVVFNNPEACTGGGGGAACGPSDLSNVAADVAVFHAAGIFTRSALAPDLTASLEFTAHLESGPLLQGVDVVINDDDGIGLERDNGLGAEIHIVVRGHGDSGSPDGPANLTPAGQISLFNGGCEPPAGGGLDPVDDCEDEQVFVFPALANVQVPATNLPEAVRQTASPQFFNLNGEPAIVCCGQNPIGGGILDRSRNNLAVSVSMRDLPSYHAAYTAWWVVFNNPEACTGGADGAACGPSDLSNMAANVAVFHAAGFFAGGIGEGNFTAQLKSGRLPLGTNVVINDDDGIGLERNNGLNAEIHIVIRDHGEAGNPNGPDGFTPAEQLSRFNGGCDTSHTSDRRDRCEDRQVFVFPAPDLAPVDDGDLGTALSGFRQAVNPALFNLNNPPASESQKPIGGAILDRTQNKLSASVSVKDLALSHTAYTAWWVVFNNPAACAGGSGGAACSPSDLSNAAADVAVFHAAGFYSDRGASANHWEPGDASFTAQIEGGPLPSGVDVVINDGDGVGLERDNAMQAEVHIVIRSHGWTITHTRPSMSFNRFRPDGATLVDRISLFNGGCIPVNPYPGVLDPPDDCEDEQVFVFPAPVIASTVGE